MTAPPRRLSHVLTRADLARVLAPTYARAATVDEDEAHERMERALAHPHLADAIYGGFGEALVAARGPRTTEDEQLDKLSAGVQLRRTKVHAAEITPAISAAMVLFNLELGFAPEMMRNALETEKGKALLRAGLKALGGHVLKELAR